MQLTALTTFTFTIQVVQASLWLNHCCFFPLASVSVPSSPETFVRNPTPLPRNDDDAAVRLDFESIPLAIIVARGQPPEGLEISIPECIDAASGNDCTPPLVEESAPLTAESDIANEAVEVQEEGSLNARPSSSLCNLLYQSDTWYGYEFSHFKPLLHEKPFNYEVNIAPVKWAKASKIMRATTFNQYFIHWVTPVLSYFNDFHFQIFERLYPALKQVSVEQKDVAGLLVLGMLVSLAEDEFFFSEQFRHKAEALHFNFDSNSEILKYFSENSCLDVEEALEKLFQLALESDCVYTAETFFVLKKHQFDREALFAAAKASAKSGSTKLFNRIYHEINAEDFDIVELTFHAAQHCSIEVLLQIISEQDPIFIVELQKRFQIESLFTFLIARKCHSSALLNQPAWDEEDLNVGVLTAIEAGNWQMFKHFLADSWHDYPVFEPLLKRILEIIYLNQSEVTLREFVVANYESMTGQFYAKLIKIMLKLDCPEAHVIAAFTCILQQSNFTVDSPYFERFDPLEHCLFMKNREYLESICFYNLFKLNKESGPVWGLIKGARDYSALMDYLIKSRSFNIMFAFANPNLTRQNWETCFCKLQLNRSLVYQATLKNLVKLYAFDAEIIRENDYRLLNLRKEKNWSLLHLAVVSFNVRLVEGLLDLGCDADWHFAVDDGRTPLDLAKQLLHFLEDPNYLKTHPMETAVAKAQIRNEMRRLHPDFYVLSQDPTSAAYIRDCAIRNCKAIISLLSDLKNGIIRVKTKSTIQDNDFDI